MLDLVIACVNRPDDWQFWSRQSDLLQRLPLLRSLLLVGASRILERRRGGVRQLQGPQAFSKALALRTGAALARAEWLMFLDCDLRIAPGVLRQLHGACQAGAPRRCVHLARVVESDRRLRAATFHGQRPVLVWPAPGRPRLRLQAWRSEAWRPGFGNLMLPRQLYAAVGGHDTAYTHYGWEDLDLLTRLSLAGADVQSLGQACHRSHGDGQRHLIAGSRQASVRRMRAVFEAKFRALLEPA